MAMRKLIIPIQLIIFVLSLSFSGYAQAPKERIKNSLGMEFVLIKPGKFRMGSPEDEPGRYQKSIQSKKMWGHVPGGTGFLGRCARIYSETQPQGRHR
jgi:formylglycine-generating enzyme required for sulfatase activity